MILTCTPKDYNKSDAAYIEQIQLIKNYLIKKMGEHLRGFLIPATGIQEDHLKEGSEHLLKQISQSKIRKNGKKFVTSIFINSMYASFVEFGTGMHSELAAPHMIKPKTQAALHWSGPEGEFFASEVAGQYPKPFMRGALMRLKKYKKLTSGLEVKAEILWPTSSGYSEIL